jgi:voltage-gated potassium channel Kch
MPAVLILGSGHLAYRLRALATAKGHTIVELASQADAPSDASGSTFEGISRLVRNADLAAVDTAFLVDDRDERNLEQLLALVSRRATLPIVASFYNENVAPHLQAAYPNVRILNPAKIAAPVFLEALHRQITRTLRYVPAPVPEEPTPYPGDHLIRRLIVGFGALVLGATAFFHATEHLAWLDALYFVVVTVATVGYGDISLARSGAESKIAGVVLILASTFFIWMIFSLTVDRIIKRRAQLALGRRRYPDSGHVILCGLGRLGYFIADGLLRAGERLIIVERNEDASAVELFRSRGADVYIGDARLPRVLHDIGVTRAKALYSVIDADYVNLEVGLNARSFAPGLRVVLRIFDESMSRALSEQLDIHLTFSMTAIADGAFFDALQPSA